MANTKARSSTAAVADNYSIPWPEDQATRYLAGQFTTAFWHAAVLDHLRLQDTETNILELGCADGTLAISVYKMLRSRSNAINIVAVDSSQDMVARARHRLAAEAGVYGADITKSVKFLVMDAAEFNNDANINTIQTAFPQGISVIIAINLVNEINRGNRLSAVRTWVSLLAPQGRIVFNSRGDPNVWAAVHFAHADDRSHIASINLAPELVRLQTEQQAGVEYAQLMAGGNPLNISPPICTWTHTILRNFADTTISPVQPWLHVQIDSQAMFDRWQGRIYHTRNPAVIVADAADQFIVAVVWDMLEASNPGHMGDWQALERLVAGSHVQADGFSRMLDDFMGENGSDLRPWDAIAKVIHKHHNSIVALHGVPPSRYACQLSEGSVLVAIRRN